MDDTIAELTKAAYEGNTTEVRRILREKPELVDQKNSRGSTALIAAIANHKKNNLETVKCLLEEFNANVNEQVGTAQQNLFYTPWTGTGPSLEETEITRPGWTALIAALRCTNLEIVQYLLTIKKIDLNIKAQDGYNALMKALSTRNIAIIRCVCTAGANMDEEGKEIIQTKHNSFPYALEIVLLLDAFCDIKLEHSVRNPQHEHTSVWKSRCFEYEFVLRQHYDDMVTVLATDSDKSSPCGTREVDKHCVSYDAPTWTKTILTRLQRNTELHK